MIDLFEVICLGGVWLTAIAALGVGVFSGSMIYFAAISVAGLIAGVVVFGGALTVLDIADSLPRLVELVEERPLAS